MSRLSIRRKLAVLNLGLAAVPLAVAGLVIFVATQAYVRRQAHLTLQNELGQLDQAVSSLFSELRSDAEVARVFMRDGGPAAWGGALRAFATARPVYGSVFVLGPHGEVLAHAERPPWRPRDSPYYATVAQGLAPEAVALLPVELLASDRAGLVRPTLAVVASLPSTARGSAATLVLELDADTLFTIFRAASGALGGEVGVVFGDGYFLFRSGEGPGAKLEVAAPRGAGLSAAFSPANAQRILSGSAGELTTGDRLVLYHPIGGRSVQPDDRLVAYRAVPRSTVVAPARRLGWIMGAWIGVMLAAGLALSDVAARHFTRPILHLRDAIRTLAQGGSASPPAVRTNDELEDLARDFDAMAGEVRDRRARLEALVVDLERSQHQHAALVDSIDGIVWEADGETLTFTFVSKQAERILGYRGDQWLADPNFWADHIHPDDRGWAVELCIAATKVRRSHAFEYRMVAQDGRSVWLRDSVTVSVDGAGSVRLRGLMVDITERKLAEQALRWSEASHRSLVESAPYGIVRVALDGTLLAVNPALVAMLGYESDRDLLAVNLRRGVHVRPDDWARLTAQLQDGGRVDGVEVAWRRRDGVAIAVRLSGRAVLEDDGALGGVELMAEDVTERRALEEQLRQAQKMEAVGQLAGGMAHDFNNLLSTILATAQLMRTELPPESASAADAEGIERAAERGAGLIRKLMAFSRQQRLEFQPVRLGRAIEEFARMLRRVVPENIEIEVVCDGADPLVLADAGALEQILLNLITNARDAMTHGGRILIRSGPVRLDETFRAQHGWGAPGDYGVLSMRDTGCGMDEETRRRIFEPFFTTKPVGKGTGLGMAVVYGLVKQHSGYVDVESQVGRGTAVSVYFPAGPERPAGGPAAPGAGGTARGTETILLVEDEEALRNSGKRVLEKHGYRVLTANDGAEALDIFRAHPNEISLVVSDVVMPRLGGTQLRDELRRQGSDVKMLFTSGYSDRDVRDALRLDPSLPFLPKPWGITDLLQRVRQVLDG